MTDESVPFESRYRVKRTEDSFNFVVIGDTLVGKTSFVDAVLFEADSHRYIPTVLDSYEGSVILEFSNPIKTFMKLRRYQVGVVDTSGTELPVAGE